MAIRILLIIFFVLVFVAGIVGVIFNALRDKHSKGLMVASIASSALSVVLGILLPFSVYTIDTGTVGVLKHLGQAVDVRTAGTYFDLWVTNDVVVYDAKTHHIQVTTATYSSDAQTMDVQMSVQYKIHADKVLKIAEQYGTLSVLQSRIEAIAIERAKAILSSHKAMDIIANRSAMSPLVEEAIKKAIDEKFYVDIQTVVLSNIDFSDAFESAVEDKMVAEQNQLKANYENETKIAKAKADAEAKILAAEAEAKANELLEKSLTDKILRQMYLDKWDGKLPNTVAGDTGTTLMIPTTE